MVFNERSVRETFLLHQVENKAVASVNTPLISSEFAFQLPITK